MITRTRWIQAAFVASFVALAAAPAEAYIGPGAGFAFVGTLLVLLTTFALAFSIILTWPLRLIYRWLRKRVEGPGENDDCGKRKEHEANV